jgi:hypothetical protein
VTEGYAADWTMEQLRDADRIDEMTPTGIPAPQEMRPAARHAAGGLLDALVPRGRFRLRRRAVRPA